MPQLSPLNWIFLFCLFWFCFFCIFVILWWNSKESSYYISKFSFLSQTKGWFW